MGLATGLAGLGMGMSAASDLMGLITSILGNNAQEEQQKANLQAQIQAANYNAKLEDREAVNAQDQTNEQDARLRSEQERIRSVQVSLYGKSGASLYSGSPLAAMAETAGNQELESLELRRQGAIERQRHEQAAEMHRYEARVAAAQIGNLKTQRNLNNMGAITNYIGKAGQGIASGASFFGAGGGGGKASGGASYPGGNSFQFGVFGNRMG